MNNTKKYLITSFMYIMCLASANAASQQDSNNCMASTGQFCERAGSCSIQGANWYQYVTIDKNDIFDTQGWPGVCDMVHVALVQGNCSPPQSTVNVTANLSSSLEFDGAQLVIELRIRPPMMRMNSPNATAAEFNLA